MSVIQSTQPELRYIKRQNLENEARIIGNYYRDLIRSYGIDCIYHKKDNTDFSNFKNIIDKNTLLKRAYGYDITPDYSMSAHTLTYMEVENDIFQLNKFGLNPDADVNFFFENNDFACALATKVGQFKEYPIKESTIQCEVPECTDEFEEYSYDIDTETGKPVKHYLSSNIFPYQLGLGYQENYYAENLSGKLFVEISGYVLGEKTTIVCHPYEHTDFNVKFDSNSDLYKNLKHVIENDDYLETMLFMDFDVQKISLGGYDILEPLVAIQTNDLYSIKNSLKKLHKYLSYTDDYSKICVDFEEVHTLQQLASCINNFQHAMQLDVTTIDNLADANSALKTLIDNANAIEAKKPKQKYILNGRIYGNILFYDINELGKYAEKIHPSVGDLITIDFPDENNRERYEIVDCYDKQLTQDGISPLLHKYIWKCKAKRYVNNYEDIPENEADNRLQEKLDHEALINEEIAKKISLYDEGQDKAYGGYELDAATVKNYDKQDVRNIEHVSYEGLPEGQLITIQQFKCGSKLCTDGYELIFMTADKTAYIITTLDQELVVKDAVFESGLKWLKATKDQIRFVNIEGTSFQIAATENIANIEELNLESLYDSTVSTQQNNEIDNSFVKFNGCRTYMFATENALYAKLENDPKAYQII